MSSPAGSDVRRTKHNGNGANAGNSNIPGLAARMAAAKLLAVVIEAKTPLDGLTDNDNGHPDYRALEARDRALVRAILTTALRFRITIGKLIAQRLERPLPPNASTLGHILHVAAAQILFLDVPDSAAVDLAVTHAKSDPRTARFAALVNGLLRSLARGKAAELQPMLDATLDAPDWFCDRLTTAYGKERAAAILAAHRIEAPVDFSVKANPARWAECLGGIVLPTGSVRVGKLAANVSDLPGFAEGEWWVQDAAAALPARLMGDIAGKRVADLCAAPGGKTAQLVLAGAQVTALDTSKNRLARLRHNLDRLGMNAGTVQADLLDYEPEDLFDAVLLDAPCSSTGTVRRHPDVPWTKSPADIAKLAALQARMVVAATRLVKPGGRVVFSNCSLDPLEGEELYRDFLAGSPDVDHDPVMPGEIEGADAFVTRDGTLRTTPADLRLENPSICGLDGFFAARFRRRG
ncbi:MAG: RsmB/NOP family class I SAM-dependent RNA methyltransferase [Rhizobiaceae bacterium]|nr:RsmB/NOP family class I SAM-dependent RNA methyltransferase [Rhizobiaceae bacterium]